jgi:regulation of enolase protein 1 (concanavalin A-like superfamily)
LTRADNSPDALLLQRLYSALMWAATKPGNLEEFREAFRASLGWGGPYEIPLWEMLADLEESCHRSGEDAIFVDLCHQMAADYARAGREAPFRQWYLVPVPAPPTPGSPVLREEFDAEEWHALLVWHDPTGRSRMDRTSRPGWLGLAPAVGGDLWPEMNLDAPRLMTTAASDFVAQARLALEEETSVIAGLLLWRDEQNFIRLELHDLPSGRLGVTVEACLAGRCRFVSRGHHPRQTMWLRVQRAGEDVRCLCSPDLKQWIGCGSVRLPPGGSDQVGLFAIHKNAEAQVWFDCLEVWEGTGQEGKRAAREPGAR